MLRALSSAAATLLTLAAVVLVQPARAQQGSSSDDRDLAEGHRRLEEIKVDLALLADSATFPYYIGAHAEGQDVELRGFVPSEAVKKRALDLAQRATFLRVRDALKVQTTLSPPSPLRPAQVLQQDAAELLVQHFGEARRKIGLQARPNGQIMITGPIDSMETKLAVSRLFRQLPGCQGVLNELIVEETLHKGKRVVPVTNGSLMVPVSALQPRTNPLPPPPALKSAAPPSVSSEAQPKGQQELAESSRKEPTSTESEIRKPTTDNRQPTTEAVPSKVEAYAPMPVGTAEPTSRPVSVVPRDATPTMTWKRPGSMEESEIKSNPPPSVSGNRTSASLLPAPPAQTGRRWPPAYEAKSSAPAEEARRPAPPSHDLPRYVPPIQAAKPSVSLVYQTKPAAPPVEETKQPAPPVYEVQRTLPPAPAGNRSAQSNGRDGWITFDDDNPSPAAPSSGQPGLIVFDDEPAPPRPPAPAPTAMAQPPMASDLQRQIKGVCGSGASSVIVESQRDGSLDVRVKVPNSTLENLLTSKILAIPGMSSPKVHLIMDVGP